MENKLTNMSINLDQIISISDLSRNYKQVQSRLNDIGMGFVFKNNKPQEVLMTIEYYSYLIDKIEHLQEYISYLEAKGGKKYSEEEIKDLIDLD